MKKLLFTVAVITLLVSCREGDEELLFEKTADERAAEAIASLKQDLVAPEHGWKIKYRPQDGAGAYYVLLDFNEDDKVTIRTDLGAEDGQYFEQTISYRIDNSMGLELIFENYSFFSFLFELDQASFGAEYEFTFVNETPDNALVFQSKSDVGTKDVVVFEQASATDAGLLGTGLSANLNKLAADLDKFTSSLRMTYTEKDLALYLSMDELRRTITFVSGSQKSNTANVQNINFGTSYIIRGDSIVLDDAFQRTVLGNSINIRSIQLTDISESQISICADPITLHKYTGATSSGDPVVLETSLLDVNGASFARQSDFYFSPLVYIFNNGQSVSNQITQDVAGALEMHLYYGYDLGEGNLLYGIGFVTENLDGSISFLLRRFTPVLNDNNIVFNFEPNITVYGNQEPDADISKVNIYLDALTQGDKTYAFQLNGGVYEFYNPCSGWSFVFVNANQ